MADDSKKDNSQSGTAENTTTEAGTRQSQEPTTTATTTTTPPSPSSASGPSWQTPKQELKSDLLDRANKFLEDPEVKNASIEQKTKFLEGKGLAGPEIQAMLQSQAQALAATGKAALVPPRPPITPEMEQAERIANAVKDLPPRVWDRPPIVTFPEYLPPPPPPPPIFNTDVLKASAYLFAGVSATVWAATKYYFEPMLDNLTDSRLDFSAHALSKLDEFNGKLSELANRPLPSETHPNPPTLHHYRREWRDDESDSEYGRGRSDAGSDDDSSSIGEATEVFHVDAQTQTSPPRSVISNADSDSALPPDEKLDKIQRLLKSMKDEADDVVAAEGGDLGTNVKDLTEYLASIVYKSSYTNPGYLPPYVSMKTVGAKGDEDEISKVKAEIRSVKGVLLNVKNFPSSSR